MTHQHPLWYDLWQRYILGGIQCILGSDPWTLTYRQTGPFFPPKIWPIPGNVILNSSPLQKICHPKEDPTYYIQLQNGDLVWLTLQHLDSLSITPHPPTQTPTDKKDVPVCILYGNKVSYEKYLVWCKCNINMVPSGTYRISWFNNCSIKHELWWGNLSDFGNNYIIMVQ